MDLQPHDRDEVRLDCPSFQRLWAYLNVLAQLVRTIALTHEAGVVEQAVSEELDVVPENWSEIVVIRKDRQLGHIEKVAVVVDFFPHHEENIFIDRVFLQEIRNRYFLGLNAVGPFNELIETTKRIAF
jgi:hypothetical protein